MNSHKNLVYSILCGVVGFFILLILMDYNGGSSFGERLFVALFIVVPPVLGIDLALRGLRQEEWKILLYIALLLNFYPILAVILPVIIKLFG